MRAFLTILLAVLAFMLAAFDWQATIGAGYAYRSASLGELVAGRWPEATAAMVAALRGGGWLWDPVGAFLLSLPVAPLLAAVALGLWVTRPGERRRAKARW